MNNNQISINYEGLLKLGFAVIDARYCDYPVESDNIKLVIVSVMNDREVFYYNMLKSYCPNLKKTRDVYQLWTNILLHKIEMSKQLKRDVSIMTAACDYIDML